MHLGFLTPEYPHARSTPAAGIGTSIRNMALALIDKGIQVSVFVYSQKEDVLLQDEGISLHLIRHRRYKYLGWFLYRKHLQNYLNKHIAVQKIDAMEAPDWTGITAFMKLRAPLVIRMNGTDAYFCHLEKRPQKNKNFFFEKSALQAADHLLSVSDFTARETASIFGLKKPISVIPNSVDISSFSSDETEVEPFSILYFGTIIRKKGVLELGEIFNRIVRYCPEASLYIAGNDVVDQQNFLSTRALLMDEFTEEAGKKVKWLGLLPYHQVRQQIAKAQVVVLPSYAEALPMAWLEAMAMEKALVTSNIGWAAEVMIDGETGFTVHPTDHPAYAARVMELLKDVDLGKEMGRKARERVEKHFSAEVVADRNIEFYTRITAKK